jgi:RNA polymerase sigma-70 factor (ECF subfamily)
VVLAAGEADGTAAQDALASLCRVYWQPLYAYVRRAGYSREEAEDLTQAFFARLLARNAIASADPARGRFRSFLLVSLKRFLANERERARAAKRGGGVPSVPMADDTGEVGHARPVADGDSPDQAFDRQWALALLEAVLGRVRREYTEAGRDALFIGLKDTLVDGRSETSYRELAGRLGLSEGALKVAAHRLRRRYRELLREEIAGTVAGPEAIESELRDLFAALGR